MTVTRGTTNRNERGNAADRRKLKAWMLETFGDGYTAPCAFCGLELDWHTMTKDRYPKPGRKGGRYAKGNVRPACLSCNAIEGAHQAALERAEVRARRERRNMLARLRRAQRRSAALGLAGEQLPPTSQSGA